MDYIIKYWETEEMRDMGISEIFSIEKDLNETINKVNKLFNDENFSCIEIENENGDTLYHLSNDNIKGEFYEIHGK